MVDPCGRTLNTPHLRRHPSVAAGSNASDRYRHLLFSDIDGSTRLLRSIGVQRYENALAQNRFYCAMPSPGMRVTKSTPQAIPFSSHSAMRWMRYRPLSMHSARSRDASAAGEAIRVRIGIHTCEVTEAGSGYVGMGVHRAARICATSHGGQIVLSQMTRDLLLDEAGVAYLDLGVHPLKDFAQPQHLYQVVDRAGNWQRHC